MSQTFNFILLFCLVLVHGCQELEKKKQFEWNLEKERTHNENRSDATKISQKTWKVDFQNINLNGKPMINGVFPVPDYNLVDSSFVGLGNSGDWKGLKIKGKTIIYHSFYVAKSNVNKDFIPDKPNEVFFTIIGLTDSLDTNKFTHTDVTISSRNHPHYVGQGYIKTKSNKIDFVAFITADRNEYALVNMRLFDLRIGRMILIAPKKDGTFRSLQLATTIMSSDEMDSYVRDLIKDNTVIDFFTEPDNI